MTADKVRHDRNVELHVGNAHRSPVPTSWVYRADDPYAVSIEFFPGQHHRVQWRFARDLLIDGLTEPTGEGDVRVEPDLDRPDLLKLSLRTPSGTATLDVDRAQTQRFIDGAIRLVPAGGEQDFVNLDELDDLLTCT